MSRKKVTFLFPFLSLLLFLVLSFLRCSSTDVARNPMVPGVGESEELVMSSAQAPDNFQDRLLLTLPGELLDRSDIRMFPSRLDARDAHLLFVDIPDPKVYLFDFGPEGKKFKRPLRITVSLDKADLGNSRARKIKVYYLTDQGKIQPVPSQWNRRDNTLSFWVKHFSRYALSRE